MSDNAVGISNLWSTPDRVQPEPEKELKVTEVRYPGRQYAVVVALHGKVSESEEEVAEQAEKQLGQVLQKLWKSDYIQGQGKLLHIFLNPPLNPKVTFDFGDFKLYASAGSLDPDVAQAMALDRLALVLTTVAKRPELVAILAEGHVETMVIR